LVALNPNSKQAEVGQTLQSCASMLENLLLKPMSSGTAAMFVAQNKISSFPVVIATSDFAGGGTLSDDANNQY
jgi:hypothetical protein